MKKMVKSLALMMASIATFSMVACGGNGEGQTSSNELKIFSNDTQTELLLNDALCKAFEKKIEAAEGIDFTYKLQAISDADYNKNILNSVAAKTLPDVIYVADTNVETLAGKGVFENLDPYYTKNNFDFSAYDEAAMDIARTVGKDGAVGSYFAPRTYDQPVIIVNNTLWKQYMGGVAVPTADENWTWTKLVEYLGDIKEGMQTVHGNEASLYYPLDMQKSWSAIYDAFVRSFGGYIYDKNTDKFGLSDVKTQNAMAKLKEMIDNKLMTNVSVGSWFRSGKAVMYIASRSMMSNSWSEDWGLNDISALPIPIYDDAFTGQTNGTSYYSYGSVGYAISARSEKKDLAYKFVEFVLSEEGQTIIANTGKNVPVLKSLQSDAQSSWVNSLDMFKGGDQSAFVFNDYKKDKYVRIPATYARTNNINKTYELTIYSEMMAIMDGLGNYTSMAEFCSNAQGIMERAIG